MIFIIQHKNIKFGLKDLQMYIMGKIYICVYKESFFFILLYLFNYEKIKIIN